MSRAPGGGSCGECGVCCDLYGHTLDATAGDLARWRAEGRDDLLRRVGPGGELWWDPQGGSRLDHCPFFAWRDRDRGVCAIHHTKPAICGAYPTVLHHSRCVMGVQFRGSVDGP